MLLNYTKFVSIVIVGIFLSISALSIYYSVRLVEILILGIRFTVPTNDCNFLNDMILEIRNLYHEMIGDGNVS